MAEKEKKIRSNNTYWICEKLIEDEKVRDHCHIARIYRGAAHWKCDVNLKLMKKVPVIFHDLNNLKNYDGHLIIDGIGKFDDIKVDVIPNGLEKYIAFTINKDFNIY